MEETDVEFVAAFFGDAFLAVGVGFFRSAFKGDEFGMQFPCGAPSFELLGVFVDYFQVFNAQPAFFCGSN